MKQYLYYQLIIPFGKLMHKHNIVEHKMRCYILFQGNYHSQRYLKRLQGRRDQLRMQDATNQPFIYSFY